jgi:hypothetical protein
MMIMKTIETSRLSQLSIRMVTVRAIGSNVTVPPSYA